MKTRFTYPKQSPGFMLWKVTTAWQKQLRQTLTPLGLTHVQFVFLACLQWLSTQQEPLVTQSQLAKQSSLDKMVVSETAQKLIAQGWITRQRHEQDARAYDIALTDSGQTLIDQALPLVEAADQAFFTQYPELKSLLCRQEFLGLG